MFCVRGIGYKTGITYFYWLPSTFSKSLDYNKFHILDHMQKCEGRKTEREMESVPKITLSLGSLMNAETSSISLLYALSSWVIQYSNGLLLMAAMFHVSALSTSGGPAGAAGCCCDGGAANQNRAYGPLHGRQRQIVVYDE